MSSVPDQRAPALPWSGTVGRGDLLAWLRDQPGKVGLLVVDLRRLFTINARFGTFAGDHLIETTRRRLELAVGTGALVAHLGQDDFAVAIAGGTDVSARAMAERLVPELQRPVVWGGAVIEPLVSIGIATGEGAGDALMEAAVLAVRTAKRARVSIEMGHASRLDQALGRSDLMYDLARAIEVGEFELHLQPQVDLATGELEGVEALARWRHPVRGVLGPADFIEPAESSGLILPLGSHLFDVAIDVLRAWDGADLGRLWLNLSPLQLTDRDRLFDDLARVSAAGIDPARLGLEITETGILSDLGGAIDTLEQVRAAGFDLALDDFGTGYSSLTYLRRLPVSTLKIDRTFVTGVADQAADLAIVESVVGLAHSLDMRVVAEGVEDRIHAEAVRHLGVDVGQGYWFGRPTAVGQFPRVHQPWCGRVLSSDGTDAFTRRAQLLYGALDALPCAALVTESIGGRVRVAAVNHLLTEQCPAPLGDLVGRSLDSLAASFVPEPVAQQWLQATHAEGATMVRLPSLRQRGVWDVEVRPFSSNAGRAERRLHMLHRAFGPDRSGADRVLSMIDGSVDGIVVIDGHLQVCWVDERMCEMVGQGPEAYLGRPISDFLHPEDLERAVARNASIRTNGDFRRSRFRVLTADGSYRWFEMASRPDSPANPGGMVINCHDVEDEVAAEEAAHYVKTLDDVAAEVSRWALELGPGMFLGELSRVLAAVGGVFDVHIAEVNTFEHGDLHLASTWVRSDQTPSTGSDTWVWREAAARLANEVGEVLAYEDLDLADQWWAPAFRSCQVPDRALLFIPLRSRGTLVGSLHLGVVDGPRCWNDAELAVARRIGETIAHVIVRERLDAALTRSESELQHLASHDPLTGLANRTKMARELTRMLDADAPSGCALVLLDLDGFKPVNDTAGHEVGDLVLREVAARLMRVAGPANVTCRLGGDEFVICVPSVHLDEARDLAESVVDAVREPIEDPFGGTWILGVSVGVAHGTATDAESMLRVADRAMYEAKRAGGCRVTCVEMGHRA